MLQRDRCQYQVTRLLHFLFFSFFFFRGGSQGFPLHAVVACINTTRLFGLSPLLLKKLLGVSI